VGRIGEGASWRVLAAEFSLPVETIRQWAERNGHGRSPVNAKRKAVDELLARDVPIEMGQQTGQRPDTGNAEIDAAAERDAKVARIAAGVAVQIIKRLAALAQNQSIVPKDVVAVATALDKAWGTYARINKLDDTPPENVFTITRSYGKGLN
jgi:hypothetical protein